MIHLLKLTDVLIHHLVIITVQIGSIIGIHIHIIIHVHVLVHRIYIIVIIISDLTIIHCVGDIVGHHVVLHHSCIVVIHLNIRIEVFLTARHIHTIVLKIIHSLLHIIIVISSLKPIVIHIIIIKAIVIVEIVILIEVVALIEVVVVIIKTAASITSSAIHSFNIFDLHLEHFDLSSLHAFNIFHYHTGFLLMIDVNIWNFSFKSNFQ